MELTSPYVLQYTYQRSVGPVIGRFLAALRDGRIEGAKTTGGRVVVPPTEYDPDTGEAIAELVPVSDEGVVTAWSWVAEPRPRQPLARPFAWALIRLDGADTSLIHAVDAGSIGAMSTGMRVRARWRAERIGSIVDIECFEPAASPRAARGGERTESPPVRKLQAPIRLDYTVSAGREQSRFLAAIVEGRFIGRRCPACRKVYVPPRGACPTCAVATTEEVALPDRGTVTTFCIVNVPFEGQVMKLPYVYASILLDGADIPFPHLVDGIAAAEVRMGLRVRAEWVAAAERRPSLEAIRCFVPTGEPDAPFDSYREHL